MIYRPGPDKSIVRPGQEIGGQGSNLQQRLQFRARVPELSSHFNSNYLRFLSRLHCLLWALVMTNWLVTTNLCYPAPPSLPTTNRNIHTPLFSFAGPQFPEFLLPFRKPKRIRTAFSPSQLLKLEHAFEKNQYVVGQERKELAKSLNLSETQVNWLLATIITFSFLNRIVFLSGRCSNGCIIMRAEDA